MTCSKEVFMNGPIGIFWEIDKSSLLPNDVLTEDVAENITSALKCSSMSEGEVVSFSAYGDLSLFSQQSRDYFFRIGVKLVDHPVPRKKKRATVEMVSDMLDFSFYYRPPSSIIVIAGESCYDRTLSHLAHRGHNVILVASPGYFKSSLRRAPGHLVWNWPSLARGKVEVLVEPRSIVITDANQQSMKDLKCQLVKLLELSGGRVSLCHIPRKYSRLFNKSLCLSEYGADKLIDLLEVFPDVIYVRGALNNRIAYLVPYKEQDALMQNILRLLELSGGQVYLNDFLREYQKHFQHPPLVYSLFGEKKLMNLLQLCYHFVNVKGVLNNRYAWLAPYKELAALKQNVVKLLELSGGQVYLKDFLKEYEKHFQHPRLIYSVFGGKEVSDLQDLCYDVISCTGFGNKCIVKRCALHILKVELIALLKMYGGEMILDHIPYKYEEHYKKPLDCDAFRALGLEDLLTSFFRCTIVLTGRRGGIRTAQLLPFAAARFSMTP